MRVDFYQLMRDPVEQVLPRLAERTLAGGGRLLVVAKDPAILERLDETLWTHAPAGFLPHARAGEDDDAAQPILLSQTLNAANGARSVALADGVWRDDALTFERIFHLFDAAALDAARAAWRTLADRAELERSFWKQEGGKWVKAG